MQCDICRRPGSQYKKTEFILCPRCLGNATVAKGVLRKKKVYGRSRIQAQTKWALRKFFSPITEEAYFKWAVNPETGAILPYDFFCPSVDLIVEVQGLEHYKFIKAFHKDQAAFERRQFLDKLKRLLAEEQGYNFLEIDCRQLEDKWSIVKFLQRHIKHEAKPGPSVRNIGKKRTTRVGKGQRQQVPTSEHQVLRRPLW